MNHKSMSSVTRLAPLVLNLAYITALKLIEHCSFDRLEEMVRDWFVCEGWDSRVKRAMLQEKDLMYQKALEFCMARELATKDISLLQQKTCRRSRTHMHCPTESSHKKEIHFMLSLRRKTLLRHVSVQDSWMRILQEDWTHCKCLQV